jgi:hypothetical protein
MRIDEAEGRIELTRFGAVAPSFRTPMGPTGRISIGLESADLAIRRESGGSRISGELTCLLAYEALDRELGFLEEREDVSISRRERLRGTLDLLFGIDPEPTKSRVVEGFLRLDLVRDLQDEEGLGWIQRIVVPLESEVAQRLDLGLSELDCAETHVTEKKFLKVQPFGFKDRKDDPDPTAGKDLEKKLKAAEKVWGECCIKFAFRRPIYILDRDLKTSKNLGMIRKSAHQGGHSLPGVVEVFFVDNRLKGHGGGRTFGAGTGNAQIVMSDFDVKNVTLLAHELGHVLNGFHPNSSTIGPLQWGGTLGTVLEATGTLKKASPAASSLHNCRRANNDALWCLPELCCMTPRRA